MTFIIKNEKQLDAFTNNCDHVNIRDAKYAESNKKIFVEWPAALYQDGFERILRRIRLGHTNRFDMAYFIYWCSDINSYFAHELTTRSIKKDFGPRAYLWHRTGILNK